MWVTFLIVTTHLAHDAAKMWAASATLKHISNYMTIQLYYIEKQCKSSAVECKMHSVIGPFIFNYLSLYSIQCAINWHIRNAWYLAKLRSICLNVNQLHHLPLCVCLWEKVCLSICMWTVPLRFEAFSLIVLTTDLARVCEQLLGAVWMNISESRPHLHKSMQVSLCRTLVQQR